MIILILAFTVSWYLLRCAYDGISRTRREELKMLQLVETVRTWRNIPTQNWRISSVVVFFETPLSGCRRFVEASVWDVSLFISTHSYFQSKLSPTVRVISKPTMRVLSRSRVRKAGGHSAIHCSVDEERAHANFPHGYCFRQPDPS